MDIISLMNKEAKKLDIRELEIGRSITLNGYEQDGKTVFNYDKGNSGGVYGYGIYLNTEKYKRMNKSIMLALFFNVIVTLFRRTCE